MVVLSKLASCLLKFILMKNIEALKSIYKELYQLTKNKSFVLALVELLNSQGKTEEALKISLQYDLDDDIKLALYQNLKRFDDAKNEFSSLS